ncbi:MAG: DUF4442 domain-containing protein [Oleispira sp.]
MMKESFESKLWRWAGNWFPAYWGSGAKVTYVSSDFHDVCIKLPCNWRTRNHMGITWGGSLYAALDPIYGVMLYKLLGPRFRVIDSEAKIRFLKPGRGTLYAHFHIPKKDLHEFQQLTTHDKTQISYQVSLKDKQGLVHATCDKRIHINRLKP